MKNNPKHIKSLEEFKSTYGDIDIPVVVFVGPPGCGKGTQSSILSDKTDYIHVSTGDILRKSNDTEVKDMMETGKLLPDDLVIRVLEKFIKDHKNSKGFIFDGYPRNLNQKKLFEKILSKNNLKVSNIFFLDVPEKILKDRIKERAKTSGRKDDTDPEVFKVRMEEYKDQTLPMIKSMNKMDSFVKIDGEIGADEITDRILAKIDEI
jgi:adenylate kinase